MLVLQKRSPPTRPRAHVAVSGYYYAVDFGPGVQPRHHRVARDRRCTCGLAESCPAIQEVAEYLRDGGRRVPAPPFGYFPTAPMTCPVCGARAVADAEVSSPRRGAGWACTRAGRGHYWLHRAEVLRRLARPAH